MSVSMRRGAWLAAPVLACSLLVACSDDDDSPDQTADTGVDSGRPDGSTPTNNMDAGADANIDATVATGDASAFSPKVITAQISATGRDIFYGVAHDPSGNIYAAGQTLVAPNDYAFVVAKYSADGTLQTSFGTNGYAIKNVSASTAGQEQGRSIVVQSGGKIVVAGYAEHEVLSGDAGVIASDTDVVLVRLNTDGTPDNTFGTQGVVTLNLGTGVPFTTTATGADGGVTMTTSLRGADQVWSLSQTSTGQLVVHGQSRSNAGGVDGGVRVDADFTLVRLSADGVLDSSFGTNGVALTDFGQVNTSSRAATVLANGSIVGTGYSRDQLVGPPRASMMGGTLQDPQNPWIYKVNANGTPDSTFAVGDKVSAPGIWHDYARSDEGDCEAYGAAPQGEKFVTLGYGRSPNQSTDGTDWVWFRFNADGTRDSTWGTNGQTFQDPGGFGDNGRAVVTLPDNRVLGVGGGRPARAAGATGTPGVDGMIGVLTANGQPDTTFGPVGARLVDVGGGTTDFLWGVDLSPDKKSVAAVGVGGKATDADDEDGVVVIFPVP